MGVYAPDYGFYHREVQNWIKENNSNIQTEVVTSTGRIDLYNSYTYEIYEVKPNKLGSIAIGLLQLERYSAGDIPALYGITPLNLPPDGALEYHYEKTIVTVTVTQIGAMIVYSLKSKRKKKIKVTKPATIPLPIPEKKNKDISSSGAPVLAGCLAVAALFLYGSRPLDGVRVK